VRGEVAMKLITDYPERLAGIETLFVGPDHHPYRVMRMRRHASGMLILFEGLADRDAADQLRSLLVHVHIQEAVPLEEGEYYYFQLHGVDVVTDQGQEIGRLTGYLETGANDVYIITTPDGQEVLIPAIPEVVLNIDLERRMITIRPMDGLL
jgi:16S rRNA processing protein RimM